ncbi:hypothetical protein F6X40_27425 [Paraburkholderia sp. UCT31]|uniref:hypothetical protein n=1 Tax=Paraburkholderia sp. UCT31 TaxID=2615209 RepID=UPI001CA454AA|nr:hypothetical protein [Paraburkholderia sp. UCT31]MBC8740392.1 hypothetical protein [Paraburkholderia sp. UCT31]
MPDYAALERPMRECFQFHDLDVLDHGHAVRAKFDALIAAMEKGETPEGDWSLPQWLLPNAEQLLGRLLDRETLARYQIWHDCGKPHCRTVDEAGKQHFPDHAAASARTWLAAGGDEQAGRLIASDMDFHLLGAEDVPAFAARPEAASLMLTAIAEIHANAEMFGGTCSTSFKMKRKHLERRGKKVLEAWQQPQS